MLSHAHQHNPSKPQKFCRELCETVGFPPWGNLNPPPSDAHPRRLRGAVPDPVGRGRGQRAVRESWALEYNVAACGLLVWFGQLRVVFVPESLDKDEP
eukprot:4465898-Prymnesium_polylepis.1